MVKSLTLGKEGFCGSTARETTVILFNCITLFTCSLKESAMVFAITSEYFGLFVLTVRVKICEFSLLVTLIFFCKLLIL